MQRVGKIIATVIVSLHLSWGAYMAYCFFMAVTTFSSLWINRLALLSGITLVAQLPFGMKCPLTKLERLLSGGKGARISVEGHSVSAFIKTVSGIHIPGRIINKIIAIGLRFFAVFSLGMFFAKYMFARQ